MKAAGGEMWCSRAAGGGVGGGNRWFARLGQLPICRSRVREVEGGVRAVGGPPGSAWVTSPVILRETCEYRR